MKKRGKHRFLLYNGNPQVALIIRLLFALLFLAASRMLLYFFNPGLFPDHSIRSIAALAWYGLRFDLSSALYANLPLILLLLLPLKSRQNTGYQTLTHWTFCILSTILLIPNLADVIYFRFTMKRLTGDIFSYLKVGTEANLFVQFLVDFWYMFLIWFLFIFLIIWVSRRIWVDIRTVNQGNIRYYSGQAFLALVFAGLAVIGMRGGLQLKPISLMNASQYAEAQNVPLVLNSAFTIMKTMDQEGLERRAYFSSRSDLNALFNPEQSYARLDSLGNILPLNKKNIVVIILESFSREHIGFYNNTPGNARIQGFSPFLDSISQYAATFQGFANGKRSIEGIPAILGGLPTWMEQDFITSQYAANQTNSLVSLLKSEGYTSAFFHGGTNGTMGFDQYAKSAGFDRYFGRNEYNNNDDYDGKWGIWDEPFLQYFARELNNMPEPFITTVFTLSSHHPYKVPEKYTGKFMKGPLRIQETIMYADYSLQQFFFTAKKMPWYQNSLFVITADHTSEAYSAEYKSQTGQYMIPVLFYSPQHDLSGQHPLVVQQTDIMPSVLDYLGFTKPFIAFGSSFLARKAPRFGLSRVSGSYQLIRGDFVLHWNESDQAELFNYRKDPQLLTPVTRAEPGKAQEMELFLKAVIQQYNNRMIENRLVVK